MRKRSNEQFRVIEPYITSAIPPRASARVGSGARGRLHYSSPAYDLADIDTVPPAASTDISSLDTIEQASYQRDTDRDGSSAYTQYMAVTKKSAGRPFTSEVEHVGNPRSLNLLESVRWWLLYPGRIEFLLWSGGTLLLLIVTVALVLVTMLSLRGSG